MTRRYLTEKISSSVITSLMAAVPMIVHPRFVDTYSYFGNNTLYLTPSADKGEMDVMLRILKDDISALHEVRLVGALGAWGALGLWGFGGMGEWGDGGRGGGGAGGRGGGGAGGRGGGGAGGGGGSWSKGCWCKWAVTVKDNVGAARGLVISGYWGWVGVEGGRGASALWVVLPLPLPLPHCPTALLARPCAATASEPAWHLCSPGPAGLPAWRSSRRTS
jgi:hypothetical protein